MVPNRSQSVSVNISFKKSMAQSYWVFTRLCRVPVFLSSFSLFLAKVLIEISQHVKRVFDFQFVGSSNEFHRVVDAQLLPLSPWFDSQLMADVRGTTCQRRATNKKDHTHREQKKQNNPEEIQ